MKTTQQKFCFRNGIHFGTVNIECEGLIITRFFRATNMNEHSSRSHAIFIITIECSEVSQWEDTTWHFLTYLCAEFFPFT